MLKLETTYTLDDAIEAHMRLWKGSSIYIRRMFSTVLTVPLVIYLYLFFRQWKFHEPIHWPISILAAVVSMVAALFYFNFSMKRGARRGIIEAMGSSGPFETTRELTEEGLTLTKSGIEHRFPWKELTNITEDDRYIELRFGKKALTLWTRASFRDTNEEAEWVRFAQEKSGLTLVRAGGK